MSALMLIIALFFTPCEFEDSTNCTWFGGDNQQGQVFTDIMGETIYWEGN